MFGHIRFHVGINTIVYYNVDDNIISIIHVYYRLSSCRAVQNDILKLNLAKYRHRQDVSKNYFSDLWTRVYTNLYLVIKIIWISKVNACFGYRISEVGLDIQKAFRICYYTSPYWVFAHTSSREPIWLEVIHPFPTSSGASHSGVWWFWSFLQFLVCML